MAGIIATPAATHDQKRSAPSGDPVSTTKFLVWTCLFYLAWFYQQIIQVMREGILRGPDDFMRLHQIRNWLAGNDWFDFSLPRLFPPVGGDLHWPRLIDVPVGGLIEFFDLFLPSLMAERVAVIVWPFLLFVAISMVMVVICRKLVPELNPLIVLLFVATSTQALGEFIPGRIDHHNVQILMVTLMMLGLINPEKIWGHLLVAAAMVVSLTIGSDNLIIIVLALAWIGFQWVFDKGKGGQGIARTGIGLLFVSSVCFLLAVAPDKWFAPVCDAYSIVYLVPLWMIGTSFLIMGGISNMLTSGTYARRVFNRLVVSAILGGATLGATILLFPGCAGGPLSNVSPELATEWLSKVNEAKTLFASAMEEPTEWISRVAYLTFVILAGGFAAWKGRARQPLILALYVIFLACAATAFYQIRMVRVGIVASVPVCIFAIYQFWDWASARYKGRMLTAKILTSLLAFSFISLSWLIAAQVVALASFDTTKSAAQSLGENAPAWTEGNLASNCSAESENAFLAGLPTGLVMNQVSLGSFILVQTNQPVVSGNYHRNEKAILSSMRFYRGTESEAKAIADELNPTYVVYCQNIPGTKMEGTKPTEMRSLFDKGDFPAWLERISPVDDRLLVLKVLK